jgi:hypothetical protein
MPHSQHILIVLVSVGSFLVVWTLTCNLISLLGWSDLARQHSAFSPATGTRFSGQSITIGKLGNYNGCITIHTSESGMHLAVFPIFRIGHPPLYLPWSVVRLLKTQQGLFGQRFLYDIGTPRIRRISVRADVHQAIQLQQSGVPQN